MKKNNLPIYFSIAVVFGMLIGTFFTQGKSLAVKRTSLNERKIKRLIDYIQRDYVDSVNTDMLLDDAIANMLDKLDPHSVYIPKENLQMVTESMQGNFVGIGVQFRMTRDTIAVVEPIEGGPSIKKGIRSGDRILMADQDTLYGKELLSRDILKILKGKPNTKVSLQVYRKMNDSLFTVEIKRGKVNIRSVDVAYMLNEEIGYIKLNRFARNSYREFKVALKTLLGENMKTLVLDLRENGGGFIDIANDIIDEFLEDEKLIVFTKNNKGDIHESFATEKGNFEKGKLYILIDEKSASASEIVAGAIQDNDKGVIIGRRSFGKGLVQQEMDLGDGSAVRLTTARYYTPTGRSIQKPYNSVSGIETKRQQKGMEVISYEEEISARYQNGELFSKDSIKTVDSLQYKTPKGKIVFGGGGIIPDVFVPIDTTSYVTRFLFNMLNEYTFEYVDNNRKKLDSLSLDEFLSNFDKDKKIANTFFQEVKGLNLSSRNKKRLTRNMKALIARDLFSNLGMYKVYQSEDKMIQKVLELENQSVK